MKVLFVSPKGTPMVAYGNRSSVGGHFKAWAHGEWKLVGGELAYYSSDDRNSMGFAIDSEGEQSMWQGLFEFFAEMRVPVAGHVVQRLVACAIVWSCAE